MSNFLLKQILPLFILLIGNFSLIAQSSISGTISDNYGNPLSGASVYLEQTQEGTLSNEAGKFELKVAEIGRYDITFSYLGLKTTSKQIEINNTPLNLAIQLIPDPLELGGVIVTGTFNQASKLKSSIASSTLSQKEIQYSAALGTAELLGNIAGTFVDASAGPIFTRVYSRGISSSAEDDIGWYYMSLQEDGLPVTNYQTTYYGPDLFHRTDLTTRRLEAVRGGSAAITSANAPGGIFNFISKTGTDEFGGKMVVTGALQGENNPLVRYDINVGGPTKNQNWKYNVGGFYRLDQGARNTDITWGNGGQIKGNLVRTSKDGYFKVYAKYLNDKVNRYQGLAAVNWSNPEPAFGQDFGTTALNLPQLSTQIADGRKNGNSTFDYNTNDGVHTKDLAGGFTFGKIFNGWKLDVNLKISKKSADWNTTIANQPLGLEGFFPYLLSGIDPTFQNIPLGNIVFRDAKGGDIIASVNNFGILGPFQGEPASFEYTEGSLPNDAVLGIAPWKKLDEATELMEQITVSKKFGDHSLTGGVYAATSNVKTFTSASYAYATYENNPRALYVTVENEGAPIVELSDQSGVSNYGGLLYNRGDASIAQISLFLNDNFQVNEQLTIDAGLRYELVRHNGEKDRSAPSFAPGGIDGNESTAYNNSTLLATEIDNFDYKYDYLSWSLGMNYLLDEDKAIFARLSNGHKTPEMNYYFNNFSNAPIDQAGAIQDVFQGEVGFKLVSPKFSLFTTAFYSKLDVAFSEFVFNDNGGITFTPTQFNQTTTIGLEVESLISLSKNFDIKINATLQNAEANNFTVYNVNEGDDPDDDEIVDYSGNKVPHNPNLMLAVSPKYQLGKINIFATWRYMGEREGNVANAFQLPAFSTVNAGIGYQLKENMNISLIANNLFNSAGLMNFFGPNEFGSNSNAATKEFINQNPNASFVVTPISPRSIFLKVGYNF